MIEKDLDKRPQTASKKKDFHYSTFEGRRSLMRQIGQKAPIHGKIAHYHQELHTDKEMLEQTEFLQGIASMCKDSLDSSCSSCSLMGKQKEMHLSNVCFDLSSRHKPLTLNRLNEIAVQLFHLAQELQQGSSQRS